MTGDEPGLREIEHAATEGNLVLVVGPALPREAGLPSLPDLLGILVARARKSKPREKARIAELEKLIEARRIAEAFSAAKQLLGPVYGDMIEKELGDGERVLPPLARAVAVLAPRLSAMLTLNLDRLLERALAGAWPTFVQVPGDLAQRRGFILKLHGTVERQAGWILTREEHDRSMLGDARHDAVFSALFRARTLLFAGCDFDEPGLEAFLARTGALADGQLPRHFALVPEALMTPYRVESLERAGVRLVACDRGDEAKVLARLARSDVDGEEAPGAASGASNEVSIQAILRCPFPGLEVFDTKDAGDFFGRTVEVSAAVTLLGGAGSVHRRWLQIEGPSGAGKSSLARAGIVPAVVEKKWVHGAPAGWRYSVIRPGFDPLRSLGLALLEALGVTEVGALDTVVRSFMDSDTSLANLVHERLPKDEALLLVVDQLEEAFTLANTETLQRFDMVLAEAVRDPAGRLYLVTTVRSDFVGRFEALRGLGPLLNARTVAERYLMPPMSEVALREAIELPAEKAGLIWGVGLMKRILEDASNAEGGLPLVAHVLRALWVAREERMLTHAAYDALGGVSGALARSADGIVDGLGEGGRERARRMLLKLVKSGRGTGDGRQTASRSEVVEAGGAGEDGERALLGLSGGGGTEREEPKLRLLVVSGERVDLVHEALIRRWKTLQGWIEESRKELERRDDLEAAAIAWEAAGEPADGLPGAGQSAYFKGAESPSGKGMRFLHAAEQRERNRIKRLRAMVLGLTMGLVLMGGYRAWRPTSGMRRCSKGKWR
jgi:hypothetical protein